MVGWSMVQTHCKHITRNLFGMVWWSSFSFFVVIGTKRLFFHLTQNMSFGVSIFGFPGGASQLVYPTTTEGLVWKNTKSSLLII